MGLVAGLAIRALFLGGAGLAGDLRDFSAWAGAIGSGGFGRAYDLPITFPPVMPWLWAALGALVPGFGTAAATSGTADPFVNGVIKVPAVLADLALAVAIAWSLRSRGEAGWLAAAAGLATALQPSAVFVSAIWGQFESLYVLPIVVAYLLVVRDRPGWAGVALAIALMTKPQALPLAVPFAAFALGRGGLRGLLVPALTTALTIALLWAPFIAAGGPLKYAGNLADKGELFGVISLHAWNPWWLLQMTVGIDELILDSNSLFLGISLRALSVVLASLLGLIVAVWVARRPTGETLAWGLVAASLVAFCALTTMHERYLFPAVMLLPLLWPDRRAIALWLVLSVVFMLNLAAATLYPLTGPEAILGGPLGIAGSLAVTAALVVTLLSLRDVSAAGAPRAHQVVPA